MADVPPGAKEMRSAAGSSVAVGTGGLVGRGVAEGMGVSEGKGVSVAVGWGASVALGCGVAVALWIVLVAAGVSLVTGPGVGPVVGVGVLPQAASRRLATNSVLTIMGGFPECFMGSSPLPVACQPSLLYTRLLPLTICPAKANQANAFGAERAGDPAPTACVSGFLVGCRPGAERPRDGASSQSHELLPNRRPDLGIWRSRASKGMCSKYVTI